MDIVLLDGIIARELNMGVVVNPILEYGFHEGWVTPLTDTRLRIVGEKFVEIIEYLPTLLNSRGNIPFLISNEDSCIEFENIVVKSIAAMKQTDVFTVQPYVINIDGKQVVSGTSFEMDASVFLKNGRTYLATAEVPAMYREKHYDYRMLNLLAQAPVVNEKFRCDNHANRISLFYTTCTENSMIAYYKYHDVDYMKDDDFAICFNINDYTVIVKTKKEQYKILTSCIIDNIDALNTVEMKLRFKTEFEKFHNYQIGKNIVYFGSTDAVTKYVKDNDTVLKEENVYIVR